MSKLSNTLMLLKILSDGKIHKINELARRIGVKKRVIRCYKEELELVGIYIESIRGRYGGYRINVGSINELFCRY